MGRGTQDRIGNDIRKHLSSCLDLSPLRGDRLDPVLQGPLSYTTSLSK